MLVLQHYALCAAAIVMMARFSGVVLRGGHCAQCGGHGDHRPSCPLRDDDAE